MDSSDAEQRSSLPAFDWPALCCCLAVLIWAAWVGQRAITLVAALLVVAGGLGRLWSHFALRRVTYERFLGE